MGAPGTTNAAARVAAGFFAAAFGFFAAATVFVAFGFVAAGVETVFVFALTLALTGLHDAEPAGRSAGVRRLVLGRAFLGVAGVSLEPEHDRGRPVGSQLRAGCGRLGGDDVCGVTANRAFDAPGEAALLEHALGEHIRLLTDVGDDERWQLRGGLRRGRGLRRERRGRSEGQPRCRQQSNRNGAEHGKPRRARKESRSHTGFLGRKGMKLNPLKGQS